MSQLFYFDKALKALQYGQTLTSKDGILTRLINQLAEAALSAELESHLAHVDPDKRLIKNGDIGRAGMELSFVFRKITVSLIRNISPDHGCCCNRGKVC